jgi:hypothetical protein
VTSRFAAVEANGRHLASIQSCWDEGGTAMGMRKRHLPSIEALTSTDDETWISELRISELSDRIAIARRMLDALSLALTTPERRLTRRTRCVEDDELRRDILNPLDIGPEPRIPTRVP